MADHQELHHILGYQFQDPAILEEALVAAGAEQNNPNEHTRTHGSKALALIGDALIRLVIVDDGIAQGASTATCDKICADEASNISLHDLGQRWKLGRFQKTNPSQKGIISRTTGATTVEALVGAVWLDSQRDMMQVHNVIHNLNLGLSLLDDENHDFGDEGQSVVDHITDLAMSNEQKLSVI